jgi:hypothetical protein
MPDKSMDPILEPRESLLESRVQAIEDRLSGLDRRDRQSLDQPRGDEGFPTGSRSLVDDAHVVSQMSTPAWLASVLTEVELLVVERNVLLRSGDDDKALRVAARAVGLSCTALERTVQELELPEEVLEEHAPRARDFLHSDPGEPDAATSLTLKRFVAQEKALLHLAGLSRELADRHVASALDTYRRSSRGAATSTRMVLAELEAGRVAVCQAHSALLEQINAKAKGQRRSRWMRLATFTLGGTLITVVNTAAVPLITPLGMAASIALGSGAAGAVATAVER